MTRTRVLVLLAGVALLLTGCGGAHTGTAASAAPVVPRRRGHARGPDLAGVQLPNFVMPLLHGSVSRPQAQAHPGAAVTTSDANVVCNLGDHASAPAVSASTQTAVYTAYGFTSQTAQRKHILDWLVPYNLGGADVQADISQAQRDRHRFLREGPDRPDPAAAGLAGAGLAALGRLDHVGQQHRPGHRPDAAGHRGQPAGHLGHARRHSPVSPPRCG